MKPLERERNFYGIKFEKVHSFANKTAFKLFFITTVAMSEPNNKRKLGGAYGDVWEEVEFLRKENERLVAENEKLKVEAATLANVSVDEASDDDDDSDDESVCDGSAWSQNYFLLKKYRDEHGHCKAPRNVPKIGCFVNNSRSQFKKGKLSQERIDKLDKIGFYWGKGHPEPKTWNDYFYELKERVELTGKPEVHIDKDPSKMTLLAKWVVEQKKHGRRLFKGKPTKMTMEQYKSLDSMGFDWKAPRPRK